MLSLSRLRIGLLSSSASAVGGGVAFSPLSLFSAGEQGAWYDPSDFSTMFQDTAGTTPVTAAGEQVGLLLDKSQGLVLGPELVEQNWTVDAGWAQSGTTFTATNIASNAGVRRAAVGVAGRWYRATITWTGANAAWRFYGDRFATLLDIGTASGTASVVWLSTGGTTELRGLSGSQSGTFTISVKELPGNHATQATSARRPTLGRNPVTGTRNLLTYTEQFDNAAWNKVAVTVTANAAVAPDGTTTADKVVPTATTAQHYLATSINAVASTYTITAYAKADGYQWLWFNATATGAPANDLCWFDVLNGVTGTAQAGATTSIEDAGNGWYRCVCRWTAFTVGAPSIWIAVASADNQSGGFTGDGTSGILIWGAQLETGSTATAYQRVVSAFDVTQAGVADAWYLSCDGTDDGMVTNTITPGIDKAQVFAGVRKLSDAAGAGTVVDLNGAVGTQSIMLRAPQTATANYAFYSGGSLAYGTANSPSNYASPITNVLTGIGDIATDTNLLRVNGSQVASSTSDQGTGNYATLPLYIGRRQGTAAPFNGRIYGLAVRFGANLTAAQITQMETWMNGKTGAY